MEKTAESNLNNVGLFAGLLALFLALTGYLAGVPAGGNLGIFIGGITLTVLLSGFVFALAWHFLFRPLPAGHKQITASPISNGLRYALALLLIFLNVLLTVAGVWDEAWHNTYGLPLGEDFLWRPHLFIYTNMLGIIAIAAVAAFLLITRGKGTLQQRLRSDPLLGILAFTGFVQGITVISDPIWHSIYGTDLTALSLPHVLIMTVSVFVAVVVIGLVISVTAKQDWRGLHQAGWSVLPAVLITILIGMGLQTTLTIDWSLLTLNDPFLDKSHVLARPDWALPLLMGLVTAFIGMMINHSLRVYGAATLVLLSTWLLREFIVRLVGYDLSFTASYFLVIPAALCLDISYALNLRQQKNMNWLWGAGAMTLGLIAVFPLYNIFLAYPTVGLNNVFSLALATLIGVLCGGKLGEMVGNYIYNLARGEALDMAWQGRIRIAAPLTAVVLIAFSIWFIVTAVPPLG